jgi:dephospho-CoA kinase
MGKMIGLTGSIGSGKSTVAAMFRDRGIPVQDADVVAREVVRRGTPGWTRIVEEFGPGITDAEGELDRAKLATLVFEDPARRRTLNAIVHPLVRERQAQFVQVHAGAPMIVLEIPLLLEAGQGRGPFDRIVVVTCSERNRFGRLKARGFNEREIIARLGAQMPQAVKVGMADAVIDNDGDWETTRAQVDRFIQATLESGGAPADQNSTSKPSSAVCGAI